MALSIEKESIRSSDRSSKRSRAITFNSSKIISVSLRLELEKRRATIESAAKLDPEVGLNIVIGLRRKYGTGLTTEFVVNPALLGGVRIRVGSDVWDSSVRNRLERLQQKL